MRYASPSILVLCLVLGIAGCGFMDDTDPPLDAAQGGEKGEGAPGGKPPAGPPAMPPAPVEVAEVLEKTVPSGRTFTGTIRPSRRSRVGSEFAGLVEAYLCREGDRVEEDAPLARLSTDILELRIEAAEAERDLGIQQVAELVNGSRPEEIDQARARVQELEAGRALREWKLDATKRLFEQNTISEDELRDARLAVKGAELLLDAAKAALALVEAGPRKEQIEQARAQLKQLEAEVKRLAEEKRRHTITAPFTGWIVKEHAEVGQWLSPGSLVVEIVALDEVDVVVNVVEDFVGSLAEGMPARVTIEAIPGEVFTGKIHRIVPSADIRGRTFPVKIRLPNVRTDNMVALKEGMFASATLAVDDPRPVLLVPKDAIVLGGPVPVLVWIVDAESSTAKMVPVQLGIAFEDLVQVSGPLEPGMQVVIVGNERIMFPGQPLQVVGR